MKIAILFVFGMLLLVIPSAGQERFSSQQWGFSMESPKKWIPMTKVDRQENLDKFDLSDEALKRILDANKGATFIQGFHKYDPATTPGLIPAIQIEARKKPPVDYPAFKAHLIKSSGSMKNIFPDIVFSEPQDVEISGIKSLLLSATFTMTSADEQVLRARSRIYSIPLQNHFFQVTFNDGQDPSVDCTEEFLRLSNSIKIGVK